MTMARRIATLGACLCLISLFQAKGGQVDPTGVVPANLDVPSDAAITLYSGPPPMPGVQALAASPSPTNSFQALDDNDTWIPPDTHGAVGPNHLMAMHNGRVRIQDRNGNAITTTTLNSWWGGTGTFQDTFDPRILYDPYEDRWIAVAVTDAAKPTSALLIAVSQTGNPTNSWYKHNFDGDANNATWVDFPTVGFNKRWVVVQVNIFSTNAAQNYPFVRSRIYVFNKTNIYAGGTSRVVTNLTGSLGATQFPATTYDTNLNAMYLVQNWNGTGTNSSGQRLGFLRLYTITGNTTNPLVTATTNYPATARTWTNRAPLVNYAWQSNTTVRIDSGDDRMQSVTYRNGHLWCAHTVFLPATSVARSGVQWWQIVPTNGVVVQQGRIQDAANIKHYAYPSIGVNRFNDVLIGYTLFSSNQYASANYVFRNFYDPVETVGTEVVLKVGEGIYYKTFGDAANRWGDYSATMPDPVNDIDLWTIQEYAATPVSNGLSDGDGRWGTWWGRIAPIVASNDNFTAAREITGSLGSATDDHLRATKEAGEPNHPGNAGGKSIWYTWTALASGQTTISTIGSSFNTTLGIYTGSSVSGLTSVTNDNDSGGNGASRVIFTATSNTTYKIAVDGFNGVSGTVVLNWSQPTPPVILVQPQSTNVVANANENATFSVTAVGNPFPAYQWRRNGTNIAGANTDVYNITNVQSSHAGDYTAVCTNTSGSVTSTAATLFVHGDSAARLNLIGLAPLHFGFRFME